MRGSVRGAPGNGCPYRERPGRLRRGIRRPTALTVGAALQGLVLYEPSATASLYTAALIDSKAHLDAAPAVEGGRCRLSRAILGYATSYP